MSDHPQNSIFRKEALERLSSPEQLDQLMQVVRPGNWLPLTALGALILLALIWSIFGRIPITATGKGVLVHPTESSNELVGLTYFENAVDIRPGMEILLLPNSMAGQSGGVVARVKSVSAPFTTLEAARQTAALDADTSRAEPLVEVVVELERDLTHASGYRWSTASDTNLVLSPGTTAIARITLAERSPIAFVFPFLEVSP